MRDERLALLMLHSTCKGTPDGLRYAPGGYWWAGGENAILTEPTSSRTNSLKTRRLPPVGCTLCWLAFIGKKFMATLTHALSSYQLHRQPVSMPIPSLGRVADFQ